MGQQNKAQLPTDSQGRVVEIPFKPVQALTCPGSLVSQMTSAFNNGNSNVMVRIVTTVAGHYALINSSGNATSLDHYLPANVPYDIMVDDKDRIAFLGLTSNGRFYATVRGF